MTRQSLMLSAGLLLLPLAEAAAQNAAAAQRPCTPTLSNPCRPPPALGSTISNVPTTNLQRREPTRIDDSAFRDIQFDRHTSFGIGHGGIIGLERKFDYKD
jgi:hypothetical protein